MVKIKTADLTGPALDWAVAKAQGLLEPIHNEPVPRVVFYSDQWQKYMRLNPPPQVYYSDRYEPSTDWSQGGPIIEREGITVQTDPTDAAPEAWSSYFRERLFECDGSDCFRNGPTPLIAAMRCFVASKLGEEVEVPDELFA